MEKLTFGVELQNVNVAVCVGDGYVELFVRGEEGSCDDFDGVGRFAKEAELVGFFLYLVQVALGTSVSYMCVDIRLRMGMGMGMGGVWLDNGD